MKCVKCGRPIYWFGLAFKYLHVNPKVGHKARPPVSKPVPVRPCGCPA